MCQRCVFENMEFHSAQQTHCIVVFSRKNYAVTGCGSISKKHAQKRYASEFALSLSELGDTFSDGRTPEKELYADALHDAIDALLYQLTPTARSIFVGRYYFFDSIKKIASYCGVAEGTVKSSLHRSRQALKEFLIKEGFEV